MDEPEKHSQSQLLLLYPRGQIGVKKLRLTLPVACIFSKKISHMFNQILIFFLLRLLACSCSKDDICIPSACGDIRNISYPFRLQSDPITCGDFDYNLSCENNSTASLHLEGHKKYLVKAINYDSFTIRLADAGVDPRDCASMPRSALLDPDGTFPYSYSVSGKQPKLVQMIYFIKCPKPVLSPLYKDMGSCEGNGSYSYVNIGGMDASDVMDSCRIEMVSLLPGHKDYQKMNMSFIQIHNDLAYGFELSWFSINCKKCDYGSCYLDSANHIQCEHNREPLVQVLHFIITSLLQIFLPGIAIIFVVRSICGTPFIVAFLVYKWRKRHLSEYDTIEEFLQSHNNLMPVRYTYFDIRKMSGRFKEKLGEGGFGAVFKGKLRSGRFAAIKMLKKPESGGQDFMSEVATIGRIHHTNIVTLIGFCVEGSKRALVYDFMSNGSLDKFIFAPEGSVSLSSEMLHKIALGVARGIEYLHRGCDIQILHFDIKPHNILLDENFIPKISDFGLAKFYPTKGTIDSLTAARGTIGYMAPELFYKNIGRVSYKADVYSFGMLLLEMAGKRKKVNASAENSSQIYYPFWVYDQLSKGKFEISESTEEENIVVRKMILTGLWCIQMQPSDRPPMNKVVEMLEGDLESLRLPPRPVLYPEEPRMMVEGESSTECTTESSSLIQNPAL
ncbi:rust resistance kinase Lr10-like [Mercurialis annua]|uniref:rust resistance kinase Lr10-like n=1 Tax=Mercurialis annua TaxID=3986 RepID=UPI00215EA782|nr:rust resistance kinase Lr10-like [Mercurialis annua]